MYDNVKYQVTGINSKGNENAKSHLEAKFMFEQEIAPRDKAEVKDRVSLPTDNGFDDYLKQNGFKRNYNPFIKEYDNARENTQMEINKHYFGLGFDLKVEAKGEVSRKEMFDLDGLNDFILTGKME